MQFNARRKEHHCTTQHIIFDSHSKLMQGHWQKKFGQAGDTLKSEDLMIEIAQVVLAIYGVLLIVGGIIGKVKSGSSASLFAGAICGIAALVGYWQSLSDPAAGFLTGGLVGLLLTGIFMSRSICAIRFRKAFCAVNANISANRTNLLARLHKHQHECSFMRRTSFLFIKYTYTTKNKFTAQIDLLGHKFWIKQSV